MRIAGGPKQATARQCTRCAHEMWRNDGERKQLLQRPDARVSRKQSFIANPAFEDARVPQTRSPAMYSQGFTSCHRSWRLFVTSPRHMPTCRYRLLRGTVGRFIDRSAPVRRLGITLKHRVEGGRCPFALGTPAILGAHNSDTLMQQPDHQSLV